MPGHGSDAPGDRANDPNRQVGKESVWDVIGQPLDIKRTWPTWQVSSQGEPGRPGRQVNVYGRGAAEQVASTWRRDPNATPEPVQAERFDAADHPNRQVGWNRSSSRSAERMKERYAANRGDPTQGHTWKPSPEKFE